MDQSSIRTSKEIQEVCLNLMATAPVCYLTTLDSEGCPCTDALGNLRCAQEYPSLAPLYEQADNEFLLYVSTDMQSAKVARIRTDPRVCVYFCDPKQIVGFMLGGRIEIVTDRALKNRIWQDGWTMYYPEGPEGPGYGILRLAPAVVRGWCRNQPFELRP